ncbi:hypothetical protein H5P28_19215 [Ruficoccus amylovorans]|uniref:Uncharacterized protein n=1 Tax=Ruficoccus amylovorans TaxID=1804625 RepID=A0A842HL40_9BACT|nr:hypothetical protein [Ruficoccus amylovorans]MBC2596404.1 hypothetical protein [Ruficoccus amylovorans]
MSRIPVACLVFAFVWMTGALVSLRADDEILRNGDFSRGTSGWKGDRKIQQDGEGNKYMLVEADDDEPAVVVQDKLDGKGLDVLVLRFRCLISEDYTGEGVRVRLVRPSGSAVTLTLRLTERGEWMPVTARLRGLRKMDEFALELGTFPGKGSIAFDDVSVRPLGPDDEEETVE